MDFFPDVPRSVIAEALANVGCDIQHAATALFDTQVNAWLEHAVDLNYGIIP